MMRGIVLPAIAAALLLLGGCVERQMTLVTEPEGARAYYNNRYIGQTPVTFHFTYHETPDIRLEKDGYRTLRVSQKVKPPLYERFPLDFFSEVLTPWTIYDRQRFAYRLEEAPETDPEALTRRAAELARETMKAQAK